MSTGYLERTGVRVQSETRTAVEIERYAAHMDFLRDRGLRDPDDRPSLALWLLGWRIGREPRGRCWSPRCIGKPAHPRHD